jgi:hypothetical protein
VPYFVDVIVQETYGQLYLLKLACLLEVFIGLPQQTPLRNSKHVHSAVCSCLVGLSTARIFFPDCPEFIFPVRNKVNTHSGRRESPEVLQLAEFLIDLTILFVIYDI